MPEIGPMMRALELQRLIEDKVSEWRERSARVAGVSVADSYQPPLHFKRHTNRRKNSTEINRIIAKYSKTYNKSNEKHNVLQQTSEQPPKRPARQKKIFDKLKSSKSEDNLANMETMEIHPEPRTRIKSEPRFSLKKYNAKSCEDITAFIDFDHSVKSKNFQENSIINAKKVTTARPKLHSICEDILDISDFKDGGVELRHKTNFATSTPLSNRRTCPSSDTVSMISFEKCDKYSISESEKLRKGISEPDMLRSDDSHLESVEQTGDSKSVDGKKGWKILKPHFRKGTFDCILRWRGKKPQPTQTK
ncbi:unnamed protein product [Parnassius apollo]|uniref:(apollo) hypothetical protein n=1 Tax=Parnassius apollo TaxID=110799 RepID=A0A8S3XIV9_PARAO|nr:unnamed protein product [Parnassius apollo]